MTTAPVSAEPTAKELLERYLASNLVDARAAADLFDDDGAFEVPWLTDLGLPDRYVGRAAIAENFTNVQALFPGLGFTDVTLLVETPLRAVAEYAFRATSSITGHNVHMKFWAYVEADRGHITVMREVMNMTRAAVAVFPGGVVPNAVQVART